MDGHVIETVAKTTGIGGLTVLAFLFLFRDLIRKTIFASLTKEQSFRLLNRIAVLIFLIAALGIASWVAATLHAQSFVAITKPIPTPIPTPYPGPTGPKGSDLLVVLNTVGLVYPVDKTNDSQDVKEANAMARMAKDPNKADLSTPRARVIDVKVSNPTATTIYITGVTVKILKMTALRPRELFSRAEPTARYDLMLNARDTFYEVPVSQQVLPNSTDRFLLETVFLIDQARARSIEVEAELRLSYLHDMQKESAPIFFKMSLPPFYDVDTLDQKMSDLLDYYPPDSFYRGNSPE